MKENFSRDLAELLVDDFQKAMAYLDKDHKAQQVGNRRNEGGGAVVISMHRSIYSHHCTRPLLFFPPSQELIMKAQETGASQAHHVAEIVETLRGRARRARNIFHDGAHRAEGKSTKGVC